MSKRNLILASVALAACLCWAMTSSVAIPPPNTPTGPGGAITDSPVTNQVIGYVNNPDTRAVSDAMLPVYMINPDRVKPHGPMNYAETPEDQAARIGLACNTVAYRNGCVSGCFVFPFGGVPPFDNCCDDLILPADSTVRFICAAQAVTSTYQPFGGPPFYRLRQQVWTGCPDDPTAQLLAQGDFEGIANDGADHVTTVIIDPPHFVDVGVPLFQLLKSDHVAADIVITNDTGDPGDIGSTQNFFYIQGTNCALFGFASPTYSGFNMTLYGGTGPAGSCCDLASGVCTDGLLQGACANFLTQSWSQNPCSQVNCLVCNPTCTIGSGPDLENEPDCFTNYEDTTNRGCNNLTVRAYSLYFTPLSCGQSGCGRTGTYTYLNQNVVGGAPAPQTENRRDADRYGLDLTQDTRVTWTINGKFPSQALISFTLQQTNNNPPITDHPLRCPEFLIENWDGTTPAYNNFAARYNARSSVVNSPCNDTVATALLAGRNTVDGPFRYMLIARPSVTKLADSALCGIPYTLNLYCEATPALPTGACCTKNGCVDVSALGCLLLNDGTNPLSPYYQGDGITCASLAPGTCAGIPANDDCTNSIVLTCTSCVVPYDTTFATGLGDTYGSGGFVAKDIWFDYNTPTAANSYSCAAGRIVTSTIYNCYNTKLQILKIANCAQNTSQRCLGLSLAGAFLPIELDVGPPIVDVGPWTYGKQSLAAQAPGTCFKIRVGGQTDTDFGPGIVRVDFVCQSAISNGWDTSSGRCCFWNAGTHTGSCMVAPRITAGTNTGCGCLGGYIQDSTDYFQLSTTHPTSAAGNLTISETQGVGCSTWPCPNEGEACFNAWDLTSLLSGSGGFGTITKATRNRLYFKYQVPAGTAVGSGITIDACGSTGPGFFDAAMAVYRGFNLTTGECHQLDTSCPAGTTCSGTQACTGTSYNNTELARVNDCGPQDVLSASATNLVSCFAPGETNPCLCLTVVASNPTFGQIPLNAPIYIGMGLKNTLTGSPRPFIDPVRSDTCGTDSTFSVHVANTPSCFQCSLACPGGATQESETLSGCLNYVDQYDAGCKALAQADQHFLPIADGQTYCGTSATYRTNKPCSGNTDCNLGDNCISGTCQGPDDNTKDFDYYRIQLTQPRRVTWTVAATFPVIIQIYESPDDTCAKAVAISTQINLGQCVSTVAAADACPGYIYLSVAPGVDTGVGCGSGSGKLYYATLNLGSPSVVASACCKGDMNNDGLVNGKDILTQCQT